MSTATQEAYLVVGGCGFLGRYIVEQLLARGEQNVSVFDIVQRHFDSNVTFFIGDLAKPEDVTNAIQKSGATAIFHTASPAHGGGKDLYELVNVNGTRNLIECAELNKVEKLVYTSTAGTVYNGEKDNINVDERLEYPATYMDAYNETKVKAEKMVLAANSPPTFYTCAIRPSGIFGPGDRQMISGFHAVIKNNQTRMQIGNNQNLSDFTYVGNVAHAHLLAMDKLKTVYPYYAFRDPIPYIEASMDHHRIPTSEAHPLGPNASPTEADSLAEQKFRSNELNPEDQRPVLRNKLDHFGYEAQEESEDPNDGLPIAGQAYFVTNGEPIYFWDFARTIWRQLGHTPPYIIAIPTAIGLILAVLAEMWSKLMGKEPGFTKFRVALTTQQRYYAIEKSRRMLGYEPKVGLVEGMEKWTTWYRGELDKQQQSQETEKTK